MARRANAEGSVYKLKSGPKKGQWMAVVSVGRASDGKRVRRSRVARTQADALALLKTLREDATAGLLNLPRHPKVADYLERWLADTVKPNRAGNTHALYANAATKHVCPQVGGIRIDDLTPLHVQAMVATWDRLGVGKRTQQVGLAVLSQAMAAAVTLGLVRVNPCRDIPPPTHERKSMDPFAVDEARAIINAAASTADAALLTLAFSTGMREGELFGLPWRCVDLFAATVKVEQQVVMVDGKTAIAKPKTKRSVRTIDLTPDAVKALTAHRAELLKCGEAGRDLVFTAPLGGMMSRNNFRVRFWRPTLARAGVRPRTFHEVRHTYATLALGAGVPVHVVSAVLGHARASITLDIYSHALPSQQTEARDTIARLLG